MAVSDALTSSHERIRTLESTVQQLQEENRLLRLRVSHLLSTEATIPSIGPRTTPVSTDAPIDRTATKAISPTDPGVEVVLPCGLNKAQIERYSRQLLLTDGFGVSGQAALTASSVLVVGAGGIGSTVLLYLAAAGVGTIGVVDHDTVDESNLHRQVIHGMDTVGWNKAKSARRTMINVNPTIEIRAIPDAFTALNAMRLVQHYDVVVDASDNPATRYLINDACVYANKPLISGSAVGTQGQLTVCNFQNGPCYRCLYPEPTVQASCQSCSDAGVLGPVPGVIGILQAMETLKVLTNWGTTMHDRLLMYDGAACSFLNIKKPPRRSNCPVCGNEPTLRTMEDSLGNVRDTRGPLMNSSTCALPCLSSSVDVTCRTYHQLRSLGQQPHVLLDVRVATQFALCALPGAVNIPLAQLPDELDRLLALSDHGTKAIYCICRRGIASHDASRLLTKLLPSTHQVYNVQGGLVAWQAQVESSFPKY